MWMIGTLCPLVVSRNKVLVGSMNDAVEAIPIDSFKALIWLIPD